MSIDYKQNLRILIFVKCTHIHIFKSRLILKGSKVGPRWSLPFSHTLVLYPPHWIELTCATSRMLQNIMVHDIWGYMMKVIPASTWFSLGFLLLGEGNCHVVKILKWTQRKVCVARNWGFVLMMSTDCQVCQWITLERGPSVLVKPSDDYGPGWALDHDLKRNSLIST